MSTLQPLLMPSTSKPSRRTRILPQESQLGGIKTFSRSMTLCFSVWRFSREWMPREEWTRAGRELGTEREVYMSEEPSDTCQNRLNNTMEFDIRFRRTVRKYCSAKSNSSSRQPWSFSRASIFSVYVVIVSLSRVWNCKNIHTPWHATQRGKPKGSSHSPGPSGMFIEVSFVDADPPSYGAPRRRCCHSFIVSSAATLQSSSNSTAMPLRNRIQSRNCRAHDHGTAQSSSIITRVSGIVFEVRSGLTRAENVGEDSERR